MLAGSMGCACETCGAACSGRFAGCDKVWARGPQALPALVSVPGISALAPVETVAVAAVRNVVTADAVPAPVPLVEVPTADEVLRRASATVGRLARNVRRLAEAADALPDRVARVERVGDPDGLELHSSLESIRGSVAALRDEMAQLTPPGEVPSTNGVVANGAVAPEPADRPRPLVTALDALAARPEWQAARDRWRKRAARVSGVVPGGPPRS